jgi:hypothetical protein
MPVAEKSGPGALPSAVALSRNISFPQVVLHETKRNREWQQRRDQKRRIRRLEKNNLALDVKRSVAEAWMLRPRAANLDKNNLASTQVFIFEQLGCTTPAPTRALGLDIGTSAATSHVAGFAHDSSGFPGVVRKSRSGRCIALRMLTINQAREVFCQRRFPASLIYMLIVSPSRAVESTLMPLPSRSTSAGFPVVLDIALLPGSPLPPAAKETESDCRCQDQ